MFDESVGSGPSDHSTEHERCDDCVVGVADYGHKVRYEIDGRREVDQQQPQRPSRRSWDGVVGRESSNKSNGVGEQTRCVANRCTVATNNEYEPYEGNPYGDERCHDDEQGAEHWFSSSEDGTSIGAADLGEAAHDGQPDCSKCVHVLNVRDGENLLTLNLGS